MERERGLYLRTRWGVFGGSFFWSFLEGVGLHRGRVRSGAPFGDLLRDRPDQVQWLAKAVLTNKKWPS